MNISNRTPLLDRVDDPTALRALPRGELRQLADELRQELIDVVSVTGGHLGAGLGVVELTVALHYVFNTPDDRVIWDVGLNTGRMSYEECVKLLSEGVGFLRWAAELEVDGSATIPGYRIGYFMGASEITRMRDDLRSRLGNAFTYADFHGRLLQVGNMPPALMREGLFAGYPS